QSERQCDNKNDAFSPDERISACTALIRSGRSSKYDLGTQYYNRGRAYRQKEDYDSAIADFNEAIELDPKYIDAYYERGYAYYAKGDYDRAVAEYTEAIRLDPKFTNAYYERGYSYSAKGDYDSAVADHTEAIRLDPKFADAYYERGNAYDARGDYERAVADYTEAIRLRANNEDAYFARGRAYFYIGALPRALTDLTTASELNPENAYPALWLDIANKRSNLPSRLSAALARIDMTRWPEPVIRLYLGQTTPQAVLAAADNVDAKTRNERVCDAFFYTGELFLQQGKKADAIGLFRLAAAECVKASFEYEGAVAELRGLGARP
ncbi:MAG TPA: tetratricopeptide repeat protein, partial [Xanthobacteraceae bacterium]|nr:tetratricopeptide repeat protein [Xanthobacteraceae bacterium]